MTKLSKLSTLEYFSLYDEKNDCPAALIFTVGILLARVWTVWVWEAFCAPLRRQNIFCCMSEAVRLTSRSGLFCTEDAAEVYGGYALFDHSEGRSYTTEEALEKLAAKKTLCRHFLRKHLNLDDLPSMDPAAKPMADYVGEGGLTTVQPMRRCRSLTRALSF